MHASIRAVGSQEKNIEIFPSVENDEQNEFKCHPVFPAISWCWMSLLSGTEGVFTGLASAIMAPKVMIVRIVPGMYTHFFMFICLIVWMSSSNSAFYLDIFNVLVPCLAKAHLQKEDLQTNSGFSCGFIFLTC